MKSLLSANVSNTYQTTKKQILHTLTYIGDYITEEYHSSYKKGKRAQGDEEKF